MIAVPYKEFILDIALATIVGVIVGGLVGVYGLIFEELSSIGAGINDPLARILVGFMGFALTSYALFKSMHSLHGSSTDYFVEAYNFMYGKLHPRHVLVYAVFALLTVLSGGSIGPEGPALVLGGLIGYYIALRIRRTPLEEKYFSLIGGAAGVSAVFRAPITALSFVLELPYRMDIESGIFIETLIASMVAYLVAVALMGPQPLLLLKGVVKLVPSMQDIVLGIIAGLIGAFLSILMIGSKMYLKTLSSKLTSKLSSYVILCSGAIGAIIALMGLFLPGTSGAGTKEVEKLINTLRGHVEESLPSKELYISSSIAKTIATAMTLTLGGTGGIFFPIISIGVMAGYGLSEILGLETVGDVETLMAAIVAALFAGTNKVVVSAVLFSLEVVGFGGVIPSALAASISYLLTVHTGLLLNQLSYRSSGKVIALLEVYETLKESKHGEQVLLKPAIEIANKSIISFRYYETVSSALKRVSEELHIAYPVVDDYGRLMGYIELEDLLAASPETKLYEVMRPAPSVTPDTKLSALIEYFARYGFERVFVIDDNGRLIGLISKTDLLKSLLDALVSS